MIYPIVLFCLYCFSLFSVEHVYLKTPNISRQAMIGSEVGVRPFRKTGVRLEAERVGDKLIIHNYGYGSSGLTLSFGGSKEVLDMLKNYSGQVAVLGAGVVGLATAYDLLERGYEVHLYAEAWSPALTSNVAAGIWSPLSFPEDMPLEKQQLHERLLDTSEKRFLKSVGDCPEFAGVRLLNYYRLTDSTEEGEMILHFDNGVVKRGIRKRKVGIDGKLFMEDLFSKVKRKAKLHSRRFENIEDVLSLKEAVIVNCMSMGSREVFGDEEFIPVRGQLIHFKAQEIDYSVAQRFDDTDYFFQIYPWSDRILLGGVYEEGEEERMKNPEAIARILELAEKCLSEL